MLLGGDARFAGCQELGTGQSAIMWAANGSDAITVKYMMVDNQNMGWMGLGLNVLGSMKGEVPAPGLAPRSPEARLYELLCSCCCKPYQQRSAQASTAVGRLW
jgi:hypothetical protein